MQQANAESRLNKDECDARTERISIPNLMRGRMDEDDVSADDVRQLRIIVLDCGGGGRFIDYVQFFRCR
jgi:hypothetical protein